MSDGGNFCGGMLLCMALTLGAVASSNAQSAQKVGVLAEVHGLVEILHEGDPAYRVARHYEEVLEKDKIRTGPQGRAKILYDDDSMTILAENSLMEVKRYELTQDKRRLRSLIGLLQGKLRFIVTKYLSRDQSNFQVQTPTAVLGVRGSDSVVILEGEKTKAYHLFGDLEIVNSITGEKLFIKSGQWVVIFPDGRMMTGSIGPQELQEILGFFSRLSPEEQRRYADEIEKELKQYGIDVVLPLPDREPGQFPRAPKPPKGEGEGGGGVIVTP